MQKATEGIKPEDIVEIVLRRRWWIIATFCFSMIVGIYLAFTLPKIYRAETLILIQPQKVPANYVQSVSTDIGSRIDTMSQQVLSRSNLEKIIEDFNLFSEPEYKKMFMEDKIEGLRERVSFDLIQRDRRRDADAFSISFEGRDPEKVMRITNALTSYIISENLRVRENQAVGTSDFLDEELNSIRKQLVVQEEKLKDYRGKYMGGLPEQLESNLRVLDRLQEQLSAKQASIRDAKNRLVMLENQISEYPGLVNRGARLGADGSVVVDSGESLNPQQAKAQLAYLETRYTEKHPDVIRLKKIISDFEKEKGKDAGDGSGESPFVPANSTLQIEEVKAEVKTYAADISNLMAQIRVYQKRVEDTPKREQEFLSTRRDYENIKETYNSLLNRQLEAEIAVNMEKKQKGEQFRILDPARLPEKPISPDMKKLFLLSLAAGLGIGCGLVFLLEHLNTSFRRPEDVESYLGLSVLATLPLICHEKDKRRQKTNQIFSILSIVLSLILLVAFATLTFKGVDQTMALFNSFITT